MTNIAQNTQKAFELYEEYPVDEAAMLVLIKQGMDVDARDRWDYTLLHWAAAKGHLEGCVQLIQQGADINARDQWDDTPLHLADQNHGTETVELLLTHGANIWAKDDDHKTALYYDKTELLERHSNTWEEKLKAVKDGNCSEINNTQDLYHLASVMKPSNPKNVPPPKEFIRTLFLQYIPHEPKFDTLYEAIFAAPRPKEFDLQTARKEAAKSEVAR